MRIEHEYLETSLALWLYLYFFTRGLLATCFVVLLANLSGLSLPTFRFQDPVQEWKVPGGDSRKLTMQVSFNRKNEYLLASAKVNQVYIWDTRKVSVSLHFHQVGFFPLFEHQARTALVACILCGGQYGGYACSPIYTSSVSPSSEF